jgi:16S rRNA U516 pseudouridylate synthase RsuA-like enzyme
VAKPGDRVGQGDSVTLDGKVVFWQELNEKTDASGPQQYVYIKYWKPEGVICTTDRTIRDNVVDKVTSTTLNSLENDTRHCTMQAKFASPNL